MIGYVGMLQTCASKPLVVCVLFKCATFAHIIQYKDAIHCSTPAKPTKGKQDHPPCAVDALDVTQ